MLADVDATTHERATAMRVALRSVRAGEADEAALSMADSARATGLALALIAALMMIEGGLLTDIAGIGLAAALYLLQRVFKPSPDATIEAKGSTVEEPAIWMVSRDWAPAAVAPNEATSSTVAAPRMSASRMMRRVVEW